MDKNKYKNKKTTGPRVIYDKVFYILQAIQGSNKFTLIKNKISEESAIIGLPIPKGGFKNVREFNDWLKRLSLKNYSSRHFTDQVIKTFGICDPSKGLEIGIRSLLFFNNSKVSEKPKILYSSSFDEKGNIQIQLDIFPWTVEDDLFDLKLWKIIKNIRTNGTKQLVKTKNKYWKNFERDLEVYLLFLQVEKDIKNNIFKYENPRIGFETKSPYYQMPYYSEFDKIEKKYHKQNLLSEQLGPIISRCKKYLGTIELL